MVYACRTCLDYVSVSADICRHQKYLKNLTHVKWKLRLLRSSQRGEIVAAWTRHPCSGCPSAPSLSVSAETPLCCLLSSLPRIFHPQRLLGYLPVFLDSLVPWAMILRFMKTNYFWFFFFVREMEYMTKSNIFDTAQLLNNLIVPNH